MIRITSYLIITLCLCLPGLGNEEYRVFTDRHGKTTRAKLVSFDYESGTITLEQDNRLQTSILPTAFSERDQAYIDAWIKNARLAFADLENYSISAKKQTRKNAPSSCIFNEVSFRVNMTNKSGIDFGNIRVECCFFLTRIGYGKAKDVMYCETGSIKQRQLKLADRVEFETDSIKIYHRMIQYYQGMGTTAIEADTQEEVVGLIVRVFRKGDDAVFLEFSEPPTFKTGHQWNEFPQREYCK